MKIIIKSILVVTSLISISSCQSTSSVAGNEDGSPPNNDLEAHEYQKAVNRCHRTGGTRVVKIMGELRCY